MTEGRPAGYALVASVETGCRWVGCESDSRTHKIASRRIADAIDAKGKVGAPVLATSNS